MQTDTANHIKQLLFLQAKEESELRAICEGLSLKLTGGKADYIDRIIATKIQPQFNVTQAQAIPLRTRDNNGLAIIDAIETIQQWRRLIFQAKGNDKEFELLNSQGSTYTTKLKYIKCSSNTVLAIFRRKWYLPLPQHRDLIEAIRHNTDSFNYAIVQKPDKSGNSWLMIHVSPK